MMFSMFSDGVLYCGARQRMHLPRFSHKEACSAGGVE
jgi:phage tail tube protein FII